MKDLKAVRSIIEGVLFGVVMLTGMWTLTMPLSSLITGIVILPFLIAAGYLIADALDVRLEFFSFAAQMLLFNLAAFATLFSLAALHLAFVHSPPMPSADAVRLDAKIVNLHAPTLFGIVLGMVLQWWRRREKPPASPTP